MPPAFDQPRTPALPLHIVCHLLGSGNKLHPTGLHAPTCLNTVSSHTHAASCRYDPWHCHEPEDDARSDTLTAHAAGIAPATCPRMTVPVMEPDGLEACDLIRPLAYWSSMGQLCPRDTLRFTCDSDSCKHRTSTRKDITSLCKSHCTPSITDAICPRQHRRVPRCCCHHRRCRPPGRPSVPPPPAPLLH